MNLKAKKKRLFSLFISFQTYLYLSNLNTCNTVSFSKITILITDIVVLRWTLQAWTLRYLFSSHFVVDESRMWTWRSRVLCDTRHGASEQLINKDHASLVLNFLLVSLEIKLSRPVNILLRINVVIYHVCSSLTTFWLDFIRLGVYTFSYSLTFNISNNNNCYLQFVLTKKSS